MATAGFQILGGKPSWFGLWRGRGALLLRLVAGLFLMDDPLRAQSLIYFSNSVAGLSSPIRDTYGCLLDASWKVAVLVGPVPDVGQMALAATGVFAGSNGCGTGLFRTQSVPDTWPGNVYVRLEMWKGTETWDQARADGNIMGASVPVQVTLPNPDIGGLPSPSAAVYVAAQTAVGPLTTWMLLESVSGRTVGAYFGQPVVAIAGDDVSIAVAGPPFPGPFNYRSPGGFRWEQLNAHSGWVDVGDHDNTLHWPAIGWNDGGQYRVQFDFGCCAQPNVVQVPVIVVAMDRREGLTLSGPSGPTYRVEFMNSLQDKNWQSLTNVVLSASGFARVGLDFSQSDRRFYRVVYPGP